ncbi:hypothetical protein [Calothrix sp. PCC 6303]|uniref:hypothetical protein n=1 Tax=Calothrix sp. PCC 6303 TaxID=1170562 RepID=UPI0002A04442|nr:hypothetical protein [Calothrix sp. PCC 6303]AFZ04632.1 hypothetical protein Cal6303_5769 [Calothrix sp. PCC 6303]
MNRYLKQNLKQKFLSSSEKFVGTVPVYKIFQDRLPANTALLQPLLADIPRQQPVQSANTALLQLIKIPLLQPLQPANVPLLKKAG